MTWNRHISCATFEPTLFINNSPKIIGKQSLLGSLCASEAHMAACANTRDERQGGELVLVFIVTCRLVHPDMVIYGGFSASPSVHNWSHGNERVNFSSPLADAFWTDLIKPSTSTSIAIQCSGAHLAGQNISLRLPANMKWTEIARNELYGAVIILQIWISWSVCYRCCATISDRQNSMKIMQAHETN